MSHEKDASLHGGESNRRGGRERRGQEKRGEGKRGESDTQQVLPNSNSVLVRIYGSLSPIAKKRAKTRRRRR